MTKNIELLAPAGSFEAFVAAVENGADAIYLGGKAFNARQFADNFDDEKLKEAVEYAHVRGVRVYLTLNILLNNREIEKLTEFLIFIHSIGIDGVIVQDLGVARFIKSVIPEMVLHASTQMTIHNLEGAKELEKLGFERVVLARELSVEEIKFICQNTSLEVEVFVHGALCVCYSGQCLMSSMIGGRSGNRGKCAQPCRLQYSLESEGKNIGEGYLLSPKDLCTIHDIGDIIDAGVMSLKVEGRMKRPEYVATVIGTYRKHIDEHLRGKKKVVDEADFEDLQQIFNRGGFTRGYFYGKTGRDMMSFEKPNNWGVYLGKVKEYDAKKREITLTLETHLALGDGIEFWAQEQHGATVGKLFVKNKQVETSNKGETVSIPVQKRVEAGIKVYKTSSQELLERARESYKESRKKIDISGEVQVALGSPIKINVWDEEGNSVEIVGSAQAEKALNKPLTEERLKEQLNKLGNTPFRFDNIEIRLEEGIAIPVSEINNVRREAVERLEQLRISKYLPEVNEAEIEANAKKALSRGESRKDVQTKLAVYLSKVDTFIGVETKVARIYIPVTEFLSNKEKTIDLINKQKMFGTQIFAAMPRIMRQNLNKAVKNSLEQMSDIGIDGVLITGIGQLDLIRNHKLLIAADFSFNVFNSFMADALKELQVEVYTLSPELHISQAKEILRHSGIQSEAIVYGRMPLMITEYCPVGSVRGGMGERKACNRCCGDKNFELVDRMKNKFPVVTDNIACQSQILNSKILFLGEELEKVISIKPDFVRLNFTTESAKEIEETISFHKDFLKHGKGILDNYREYTNSLKNSFTKGHYFRGVE